MPVWEIPQYFAKLILHTITYNHIGQDWLKILKKL